MIYSIVGGSVRLLIRAVTFWNNVTVHSVLSNVAKIHSRLPVPMEFWLVCPGGIFMPKHLAGQWCVNSNGITF